MIKILVANRGQADLYETSALGASLMRVRTFTNESAYLHESDLVSDGPGRVYNRVAGIHQSYGQRHSIRDKATEKFTRDIAGLMTAEIGGVDCLGLVLIGAPRLINRLQHVLPSSVRAKLIGVIPKDLAHQAPLEISRCLRSASRDGFLRAK
jgi:protein required for attachment to host cells